MPKITYVPKRFSAGSLEIIEHAELICTEYEAQGYDLTLRQLFYQFVSRGWLPNSQSEYKRLGSIVNDARLAGMIDWNHITDRTRNLRGLTHWTDPAQIIRATTYSYMTDRWANQASRVEVWVEKDALVGVIAQVCNRLDVPYFSCRGYTSQSELWSAARRLGRYSDAGQTPIVIHLGDHDPSGIDMTRDIGARLGLFDAGARVVRVALNMDQVEEFNPPPNPAKLTDSRASGYVDEFGGSSWELDALDPATLDRVISTNVAPYVDRAQWDRDTAAMEDEKRVLQLVSDNWTDVQGYVRDEFTGGGDDPADD